MPSSCKDIRAALATCLQNSDCVLIERNKPSDCLRHPLVDTLPPRCLQLKKGYTDCKRGMIDMRKRFRGNKPVALSAELEAGADDPKHMLYAGGSAISDAKERAAEQEDEDVGEIGERGLQSRVADVDPYMKARNGEAGKTSEERKDEEKGKGWFGGWWGS